MSETVGGAFVLNTDIEVGQIFFRKRFADSFNILPGIVLRIGGVFKIFFLQSVHGRGHAAVEVNADLDIAPSDGADDLVSFYG